MTLKTQLEHTDLGFDEVTSWIMRNVYLALYLLWAPIICADSEYQHLGPVETLDNGTITLQVALEIGRVVSYRRHKESDWIVVFDEKPIPSWHWNPWGGDRMWPTAQFLNPQIYGNIGFDPVIDGQPWKLISKTETSLEMRSGISSQLGLQVTHRIELIGETTEVIHTYIIKRLSDSKFPVHVWAVTGVRAGDYFLMESDPDSAYAGYKRYRRWPGIYPEIPSKAIYSPDSNILNFAWSEDSHLKLGTYGRWVALVAGRQAFCQQISYHPDELYLEASNLQAYVNVETGTYELETLSPTWFLSKGEERQWTVSWQLVDLPSQADSVEADALFVQKAMQLKFPVSCK